MRNRLWEEEHYVRYRPGVGYGCVRMSEEVKDRRAEHEEGGETQQNEIIRIAEKRKYQRG